MSEAAVALAPWIAAQRTSLLAQRGHAWLLQGPSGLGQYALGLELVRAWLCDNAPTLPAARGSLPPEGAHAALGRPGGGLVPAQQGACGHCGSCHAIDVRTHADLCVLMPEVQMMALGWPLSEKAQADIDDKKRKPSREIRVEAMRGCCRGHQGSVNTHWAWNWCVPGCAMPPRQTAPAATAAAATPSRCAPMPTCAC